MDKQRRWKLFLILTVIAATLYNILPTLLYYCKPLGQQVSLFEAEAVAGDMEKRLADLEKESVDWVRSYCKLIHVKPLYIRWSPEAPQQIRTAFAKVDEAKKLRAMLYRAGALISFAPAKLQLPPQEEESKEVLIQRMIPCRLQKEHFYYVPGGLLLNRAKVQEEIRERVEKELAAHWSPTHPDLKKEGALQLLLDPEKESLFVRLKGAEKIGKLYANLPESDLTKAFSWDLKSLALFLYSQGFQIAPRFAAAEGDLLFEKADLLQPLLAATREKFTLKEKIPFLPLTTREERILTENRIETEIQKDLVKWTDDYRAAQVHLDPQAHFEIAPPTKSAFWNNLALSFKKYWRGDERKILRWGLDLSGGKSVQIELLDANRKLVTDDASIKKGIEELTRRVNKMGVSEVSIRQIGHQVALDFPDSQSLSARDLIKASTMSFHLVNENFSFHNGAIAEPLNKFLQDVWNEAVLTDRRDSDGVNAIAAQKIHSGAAKNLWEAGLRFLPDGSNTPLSKVAIFRGEERADWHGQSHPLLIVFEEAALVGKSLSQIRTGYDPSKGNFLSFDVEGKEAKDQLYSWASRFCKETIEGTEKAALTNGRGWRMAALLNDTVISTPSLEAPLREGAMITGSFSPREVALLAADLEAGSLTFTPKILLEKNIHPELGKSERARGIAATFCALLLVIGAMLLYYRFAGLVASVAVMLNLLILWAVLQNLEAVLTLGSIAGIILTVGMAVDANVLVFERIKEELAHSGNMRAALHAGYKKAYSAIVDSNLTTVIAALILLNFDAGPIKSFALNLLIGIISSMFTALFMTRFYFEGWLSKRKSATLKMRDWIKGVDFPFLKWTKPSFLVAALIISLGCSLLWTERSSIFGMDFRGGYALQLELEEGDAAAVKEALVHAGALSSDIQAQQLQPATHVRLLLATQMELPGRPFYGLSAESEARIDWIVAALSKQGLKVAPHFAPELSSHWTAMSGQVSDTMRAQALYGLALAFLAIFIYLAMRFEYRFATASVLCLLHDLFITLGAIGILHLLGIGIQIDLTTVAAIMTIIGYSLNDTIIIFDRIREEMSTHPHQDLSTLVNRSLNTTLSRTVITSGTTLLVLIALAALGGSALFNFSLTMTIGVLFGTLSSWFIAAPLLILLHRKENKRAVL